MDQDIQTVVGAITSLPQDQALEASLCLLQLLLPTQLILQTIAQETENELAIQEADSFKQLLTDLRNGLLGE